jgi:predicted RND superfamily exporter protein
MRTDLRVLIPLVIVVILAVLSFSFHHFTYVTLPLLTVIISVIWTIGAMPLGGVQLSAISIILPIILIAVGSAYGIHVISHYIDETEHKTLSREEHRALVFNVLRKVRKPVLLAGLTTMAGFVSFVFTFLKPLKEFGVFSSVGVVVAVVISLTFIPVLILIRGPRAFKQKKHETRSGSILGDVLMAVSRQKAAIVTVTAFLFTLSLYGLGKVVIDNSMVEYFRPNTDIYQSDTFIRKYFGGTTRINVAIEADSTEILLSPRVLTAVDNLGAYLGERVPGVSKVSGFTDMVKRMNQMFNMGEPPEGVRRSVRVTGNDGGGDLGFSGFGEFGEFEFDDSNSFTEDASDSNTHLAGPDYVTFAMLDSALGKNAHMNANELVRELQRQTNFEGRAYYEIPSDPVRYGKSTEEELEQLIANYLVLVGGDSESGYTDDPLEPKAFRSVILVNSKWWADTKTIIDEVNNYVEVNFPDDIRVVVGGGAMLIGEIADSLLLLQSQVVSIFISILIVFVILALANKSIVAGFFGAVPLSIAIVCNFGLMGFLGITLNLGTALVSSLSVGIGIDYTIHFMEFFKLEHRRGGDFLYRTFIGCGKGPDVNAGIVHAFQASVCLRKTRRVALKFL